MKKLLIISCILFFSNSFSQSNNEIKTLEYANMEIAVPDTCTATSKHEILDCDGLSIQWAYVTKEALNSASNELITQFSTGTKTKEEIEVTSFGAVLKGYKFTYENPKTLNRLIVSGIVNKQPLILNVASEDELMGVFDFNLFLTKIVQLKM